MIGKKIRNLRKKYRMTLTELAGKIGFTASYLSQLERDMIEPSLTALRKICRTLDVPVYYFLEDLNHKQACIIRANERQKLDLPNTNVVYEFMTPMGLNQNLKPKMEIIYVSIEPQKWSNEELLSHNADECNIVLKGSVIIYMDDEEIQLDEGDSVYIIQNVKHRFFNPTNDKAYLLSVICPPIY